MSGGGRGLVTPPRLPLGDRAVGSPSCSCLWPMAVPDAQWSESRRVPSLPAVALD